MSILRVSCKKSTFYQLLLEIPSRLFYRN